MKRLGVLLAVLLLLATPAHAALACVKNTANFFSSSTTGMMAAILNGLSVISVHAIVEATSLGTGTNDNRVIQWNIADTNITGIALAVSGGAGAAKVRGMARSVSPGDTLQAVSGATTVNTSTTYSIGAVYDIAGDTIRVYLDGAQDGSAGVTFTNTTWTSGSPTTSSDYFCGNASNSAEMWDGRLSEVAVWGGDITTAGFATLAARVPATKVRPDLLLRYWPLYGQGATERSKWKALSEFTDTGHTIAAAVHPRMFGGLAAWMGAEPGPAGAGGSGRFLLLGVGN